MSEASEGKPFQNKTSKPDELAYLRTLILEPEQSEIGLLKKRLDDPKVRAEELSSIIAEAIVLRAAKDQRLATALLPTVEAILRDTVKRDPRFLADTIFPVIGPAIRRSIAESFRSMIQSLSTSLDYTFSWRGLKWRIESIRSGKPFAEIVILHTLVYRMEQVFLIHKETGLVLQHVAADAVDVMDAGMVSAMLTAIQDFVKDSFAVKEGSSLDNLNLGDLTVWIERGPGTILAGVIRGNPPQELRVQLQEVIERIEFGYSTALNAFNGDASVFDSCRPDLNYLLSQAQQTDRRVNKPAPKKVATRESRSEEKKDKNIVYIYVAGAVCLAILILGLVLSFIH